MPLGFCLAIFLATYRKPKIFTMHLFWGLTCSLIFETVQPFLGRFSDLADVISNTTGYVLGYLTAFVAIRFFHLKPAALIGLSTDCNDEAVQNISGIRFVFVTIAYITSRLPMNISVSISDIYNKLNSGDNVHSQG